MHTRKIFTRVYLYYLGDFDTGYLPVSHPYQLNWGVGEDENEFPSI